jgi:hypothetical protein
VTTGAKPPTEISEKDLHHWQMLESFQEAVERVFARAALPATFADPRRELGYASYLSLFLFGLTNPVIESMRGLCAISRLPRVQQVVGCKKPVSLGSFSEMQALLEPSLLAKVFQEVYKRIPGGTARDPQLQHLNLIIQDASLWSALPRMAWAEYGVGRKGEAKGVRLHLRFHLLADKPFAADVTRGKDCERQALRRMSEPGQITVGDRYYGEDYHLFEEIDQAQGFFVIRIKEDAVVQLEQELPLSATDQVAGIVRHAWVRLGARKASQSMRLRLVEIKTATQHLLIVTNLPVEKASAELIGLIYRRRWKIELFFRWIKCILGCRHFFAESPQGAAIQLYLALIASLLFQYYTGRRPNKRMMELIQFYFLGWATDQDLESLLQQDKNRSQKS